MALFEEFRVVPEEFEGLREPVLFHEEGLQLLFLQAHAPQTHAVKVAPVPLGLQELVQLGREPLLLHDDLNVPFGELPSPEQVVEFRGGDVQGRLGLRDDAEFAPPRLVPVAELGVL